MREIKLEYCATLDDAVKELIKCNVNDDPAFSIFNGVKLTSEDISYDYAYQLVCKCSYGEFLTKRDRLYFEGQKEEKKHEEDCPRLTEEWIKKGHEILDEKYWPDWDRIVPIRLHDLYRGMELGNCLDIIKELNNGCSIDYARKIIDNQDHSGMSYGLVRAMVEHFCDRGSEFSNACY